MTPQKTITAPILVDPLHNIKKIQDQKKLNTELIEIYSYSPPDLSGKNKAITNQYFGYSNEYNIYIQNHEPSKLRLDKIVISLDILPIR